MAHHTGHGQEGVSQRPCVWHGRGSTEPLVSRVQQCNKLSQSQGKKYEEGNPDLDLYHLKRKKLLKDSTNVVSEIVSETSKALTLH